MSDQGSRPHGEKDRNRSGELRRAVSVLLTPEPESSQVLLVRRSPRLSFFGGYWAFPGGVLEPQDSQTQILNISALRTESGHHRRIPPSFIAAAAREIFEETGVWLAGPPPPVKSRQHYRRALLANEISFADILQQTGRTLDARTLVPLLRLATPPFSPQRYDTWFLLAQMPLDDQVDIWPGELEECCIGTAEEILHGWRRQNLPIVPPVLLLLQELAQRSCRTFVPRVKRLAQSYRTGRLHRIAFSPGILVLPVRTRTLPPASHTNAYIVGEKTLYLVDPGPRETREQKKIWTLLDQLLQQGRDLEGILLTHHHADHVGALPEAVERYRVPVLAHPLTLDRLTQKLPVKALRHGQQLDLGLAPDGSSDWKLTILSRTRPYGRTPGLSGEPLSGTVGRRHCFDHLLHPHRSGRRSSVKLSAISGISSQHLHRMPFPRARRPASGRAPMHLGHAPTSSEEKSAVAFGTAQSSPDVSGTSRADLHRCRSETVASGRQISALRAAATAGRGSGAGRDSRILAAGAWGRLAAYPIDRSSVRSRRCYSVAIQLTAALPLTTRS